MPPRADYVLDRLLRLAAIERDILVRGRLEDLGPLAATKYALLRQLNATGAARDSDALVRLRKAASDNQRLYLAALAGVGRVRDRLSALISCRDADLSTYAPDGGRRTLACGQRTLEHRA